MTASIGCLLRTTRLQKVNNVEPITSSQPPDHPPILDTWDSNAINERQHELSQWVFSIWKFPDETPPIKHDHTDEMDIDTIAQIDTMLDQLPDVPA